MNNLAPINQFRNRYYFLSNFFPAKQKVIFNGVEIILKTNEHFYQASKTFNTVHAFAIVNAPTAAIAKKMGSKRGYTMPDGSLFRITLRPDWDMVRDPIMELGLNFKVYSNQWMKQDLVNTYPRELIEGNWWGDEYWGYSFKTKRGLNKLGKLWMTKRVYFIEAEGFKPITVN